MYQQFQKVRIYDNGEEVIGVVDKVLNGKVEVIWGKIWGYPPGRGPVRKRTPPPHQFSFDLKTKQIVQEHIEVKKRRPEPCYLLGFFDDSTFKVGQEVRVHFFDGVVEGIVQGVNVRGGGDWLRIAMNSGETIEMPPEFVSIPHSSGD